MKSGMGYVYGKDKLGNICLIIKPRLRPKDSTIETVIRFTVHLTEQACEISDREGTGQICVIYDRTGVESKDAIRKQLARTMPKFMSDYYPERLHCFYVLNVNWLFKLMFVIAKAFMDAKTAAKVRTVGEYTELSQFFNLDVLQKEYGGTNEFEYKYLEAAN